MFCLLVLNSQYKILFNHIHVMFSFCYIICTQIKITLKMCVLESNYQCIYRFFSDIFLFKNQWATIECEIDELENKLYIWQHRISLILPIWMIFFWWLGTFQKNVQSFRYLTLTLFLSSKTYVALFLVAAGDLI